MSSNRRSLLAAASCIAMLVWVGGADLASAAEASPVAAPVPVSDAELAGWIRDLQSDNFKARRTAMRQLLEAGPQAVGPVAAAAETDDLELATRCIDILKALRQSTNVSANIVADAALNRLTRSERASVAQRAAEAMKKPEDPAAANNRFGAVRIQFQVGGPNGRIQIGRAVRRQLEREKQVEADGRQIHIKETQGGEIVVKVTEKVEGKEQTTEYKAPNAEQLKQQHPAAHKLFEKHMQGADAPPFRRVFRGRGAAVQGQNVTIRQTDNNGQRETEVVADGRKIHISETQGKDIVVKVTEKIDGKEQTTEHKAKDLDELKKQHPAAAKLYEQYAAGQNNVGVGAFGGGIVQGQIQINGQAVPIQLPGIRIAAGGNDEQQAAAREKLQAAQEQLGGALKQLKELAAKGAVKPEQLRDATARIEAAIDQLQAAQKQLAR